MQTFMTRFGLWRTAVDLHMMDLEMCIEDAKTIMEYLMGEDGPAIPDLPKIADQWINCEHALANYGAVLCHRYFQVDRNIHPDMMYFMRAQAECRKQGWPYSRPAWATNEKILTQHRRELVNRRPAWYGPKFELEPTA